MARKDAGQGAGPGQSGEKNARGAGGERELTES
jgi:hypothetical protein